MSASPMSASNRGYKARFILNFFSLFITIDLTPLVFVTMPKLSRRPYFALTDLDLHPCEFKMNEDSETSVINVSATIGEPRKILWLERTRN